MSVIRIAIVDDDPVYLQLLELRLESIGHAQVSAYETPDNFLNALCFAEPPDLIITDFAMPGKSGNELLDSARERFPGIRGAILTSDPGAAARHSHHYPVFEKGDPDLQHYLGSFICACGKGESRCGSEELMSATTRRYAVHHSVCADSKRCAISEHMTKPLSHGNTCEPAPELESEELIMAAIAAAIDIDSNIVGRFTSFTHDLQVSFSERMTY